MIIIIISSISTIILIIYIIIVIILIIYITISIIFFIISIITIIINIIIITIIMTVMIISIPIILIIKSGRVQWNDVPWKLGRLLGKKGPSWKPLFRKGLWTGPPKFMGPSDFKVSISTLPCSSNTAL